MLVRTIQSWLPKLPGQLTFTTQTYPVLVHSIPTDFETSQDCSEITALIEGKEDMITHPSSLQHTKFVTHTHNLSQHKTCCSLIIYFTNPLIMNSCITHHIAL